MQLESWLPGRLRVGVEAIREQVRSFGKALGGRPRPVFRAKYTDEELKAFSRQARDAQLSRIERAQGTQQSAGLRAVFRELEVVEVAHPTADAVTLWLRNDGPDPVRFRAGQFLNLVFEMEGREVRRAYSLCSDPGRLDRVAVTVKRVQGGLVSNHIVDTVKAGDRIKTLGPSGGFGLTAGEQDGQHVVLVGAGSGITPLYSVMQAVLRAEPQSRVTLIYGNRTPETEIFSAEIDGLVAQYGERLRVERVYSREAGRLDEARLRDLLPAADVHLVCGPGGVAEAAQRVLGGRAQVERFVAQSQGKATGATGAVWGVRLAKSGKLLMVPDTQTLLEAGRAAGVAMAFSCTLGGCGACRVQMLEGEVEMEEPNCLSERERESGGCLACVGRPRSAVVLDL